MKVLSIKEPYATLLMKKIKHIETRSWKTNYRGEIYIHVSGKTLEKQVKQNKEIQNLIRNISMNYGYIICKGYLVDCIYMDKEYIEKIKKDKKEYLLGDYKEGRYAWIIKDIKEIKPIKAKGQLGIWNYKI